MKKAAFVMSMLALYISFLPLFTDATAYKPVSLPETDGISAAYTAQLDVSAKHAILMCEDGTVLFEKDADTAAEPASTTKIMTALVALEKLGSDTVVTVPREAVGIEGSSVYLKEGEKLTVRELLQCLLLESGNDAAVALAVASCGSVEEFVELMNTRAKALGLKTTHFENPHGLSSEGHLTTARELAVIAREALSNELLREVFSTKRAAVTGYGGDNGRLLINHNKLLTLYDDAIGVKTGYTRSSGRTLVGAAQRDGLTLIAVTLNAPDDWNDQICMFEYGFSGFKLLEAATPGEIELNVSVVGGTDDELTASNISPVTVTVPVGSVVRISTAAPQFVYAPVTKGDFICDAVVYAGDGLDMKPIATVPLVAMQDVQRKKLSFWERLFGTRDG